jgi:hypothetical protein
VKVANPFHSRQTAARRSVLCKGAPDLPKRLALLSRLTVIYAQWGDNSQALDWLETAMRLLLRRPWLQGIKTVRRSGADEQHREYRIRPDSAGAGRIPDEPGTPDRTALQRPASAGIHLGGSAQRATCSLGIRTLIETKASLQARISKDSLRFSYSERTPVGLIGHGFAIRFLLSPRTATGHGT